MAIRIVVADGRRLISESIAETLKLVRDFEVVEAVNEDQQVMPTVLRTRPSAAVLGAATSGRDVLNIADELRDAAPNCGVVVIAGSPTQDVMDRAMAGTVSVIPNHAHLTHLVHAIRGAVAGCPTIYPTLLRIPSQNGCQLNERERDVLRLTACGAPIKEVAAELYLAPGTVRNLTSSAIKKLQGRNRFDAARIASSRGWL